MAIVGFEDMRVTEADGRRVRLTIRDKSSVMSPEAALSLSNALGNLATDLRMTTDGYIQAEEFHLLPYREDGKTALRFVTNIGPMIVAMDAKCLGALAAAAEAALEFSAASGSA